MYAYMYAGIYVCMYVGLHRLYKRVITENKISHYELLLGLLLIKLTSHAPRVQIYSKNLAVNSKSYTQKKELDTNSYNGHINIKRQREKNSPSDDLAPGICEPLPYTIFLRINWTCTIT